MFITFVFVVHWERRRGLVQDHVVDDVGQHVRRHLVARITILGGRGRGLGLGQVLLLSVRRLRLARTDLLRLVSRSSRRGYRRQRGLAQSGWCGVGLDDVTCVVGRRRRRRHGSHCGGRGGGKHGLQLRWLAVHDGLA